MTEFTDQQNEFLTCKPSALIRLALTDLERCEKSSRFKINMAVWIETRRSYEHSDQGKEYCFVCLAGACVAQRFKIYNNAADKLLMKKYSSDHIKNITNRMEALNNFRIGDISEGLRSLGKTIDHDMIINICRIEKQMSVPVPEFYCSPEEDESLNRLFKHNLRVIADGLENIGL